MPVRRAASVLNAAQLPLAPSALAPAVHSVHRANGQRIRTVLVHAIEVNSMSLVQLEAETGIDEKQIGRALREDGGAHPPFALIAAVMHLDREGVFIRGLAELVGFEATQREPDHAAENQRLRGALIALRTELDQLLGVAR